MRHRSASVIVLTRNHSAFTAKCLTQLNRFSHGLTEIIVVDNGSTDETLDVVRRMAASSPLPIRLLPMGENRGGSAGRNVGARLAQGDTLVFLDNDAFPATPGWLGPLDEALEGATVAAAAPLLFFPYTSTVQSAGGGLSPKLRVGLLGRGMPWGSLPPGDRDVAWLPTACLAVRTACFRGVGDFDEALDPISIGEDVDWCFRARAQGLTFKVSAASQVFHYENVTFNDPLHRHSKREAFIKHMRLIRERWRDQMEAAPHTEEVDLGYVQVVKDYRDLDKPRIEVRAHVSDSFAAPIPDDGRTVHESARPIRRPPPRL